ncbi:MAG: molybdenum cofactor biosynthesis protein MoaB [Methanomassiliicoccales archaeon]|nr:molybdenum cofactor biosynthesis protein MoaB [Methanomassiliicoccales archaeon]
MSVGEHRKTSPVSASFCVVTVSDSRTVSDDASGDAIVRAIEASGHSVLRRIIVKDDAQMLNRVFDEMIGTGTNAIIFSGGTGITARDVTYETIAPRLDKRIDGFGELFRHLSYEEVGSAAMMSRAFGGVTAGTLVFCLPGSPEGALLAMEKLILPEIGHLVREAKR